MKIYFVRHGESEGNKSHTHQTSDVPLSQEGKAQAEAVSTRLKGINFDVVYSSNSLRAKQTAEIISKKLNAKIEFWEDLAELRTPSEIQRKNIDDSEVVKIKKLIADNFYKGNYRYSDEETFDELNSRAKKVIKHLEENHKGQTVLVVSHSTAIKAIVGNIVFAEEFKPNILYRMRMHMWARNTGITICELHEKYGWQLNSWNDTTHI